MPRTRRSTTSSYSRSREALAETDGVSAGPGSETLKAAIRAESIGGRESAEEWRPTRWQEARVELDVGGGGRPLVERLLAAKRVDPQKRPGDEQSVVEAEFPGTLEGDRRRRCGLSGADPVEARASS